MNFSRGHTLPGEWGELPGFHRFMIFHGPFGGGLDKQMLPVHQRIFRGNCRKFTHLVHPFQFIRQYFQVFMAFVSGHAHDLPLAPMIVIGQAVDFPVQQVQAGA